MRFTPDCNAQQKQGLKSEGSAKRTHLSENVHDCCTQMDDNQQSHLTQPLVTDTTSTLCMPSLYFRQVVDCALRLQREQCILQL